MTAPLGTTPDGLVALAAASGYSRFPVADAEGRPLGYLHVKDALGARPADLPFAPGELRPLPRLAAGTPLDEALATLRAQGVHLAAVTAPGEGLVGLVTLEDVLRELIGGGTEAVAA